MKNFIENHGEETLKIEKDGLIVEVKISEFIEQVKLDYLYDCRAELKKQNKPVTGNYSHKDIFGEPMTDAEKAQVKTWKSFVETYKTLSVMGFEEQQISEGIQKNSGYSERVISEIIKKIKTA